MPETVNVLSRSVSCALRYSAAVGRMIKISHTVFALPFAGAAVVMASAHAALTAAKVALVVLCVFFARTAAMTFNRLIDRDVDGRNPRTRTRELPTGKVSATAARWIVVCASCLFICSAGLLGVLPLALSPVALALALGYSYFKRFSAWCHVILGLAVAFAPGGAWIAMNAPLDVATPYLLVLSVATWVAGFDILYSLQDRDFDRRERLHSVPSRTTIRMALGLSLFLHVLTALGLFSLRYFEPLGAAYDVGALLVAGVLMWEHAVVRSHNLSRIDQAFFLYNGIVSIVFFVCTVVDALLNRSIL